MKTASYILAAIAVFYLGIHIIFFGLNTEWRNRYSDSEYLAGEKTVTYYSVSDLFS